MNEPINAMLWSATYAGLSDIYIELYTSDYFTGDPDFEPIRWSINDPRRATFWGHIAPPSWFEEASLVMGLDGKTLPTHPALLKERPHTVT
jgi:catechol 2,3-dioxygenase